MVIHILDLISKTVGQIDFKRDGDEPWIDAYYVCLCGHAPVIFSSAYSDTCRLMHTSGINTDI